jgi:hypothetical protein
MPGVEREGDIASCDHANTGSETVFANGRGITRVDKDTVGGLLEGGMITGPGCDTVFVEGFKISLPEDTIEYHGKDPHDDAITELTIDPVDVFAD